MESSLVLSRLPSFNQVRISSPFLVRFSISKSTIRFPLSKSKSRFPICLNNSEVRNQNDTGKLRVTNSSHCLRKLVVLLKKKAPALTPVIRAVKNHSDFFEKNSSWIFRALIILNASRFIYMLKLVCLMRVSTVVTSVAVFQHLVKSINRSNTSSVIDLEVRNQNDTREIPVTNSSDSLRKLVVVLKKKYPALTLVIHAVKNHTDFFKKNSSWIFRALIILNAARFIYMLNLGLVTVFQSAAGFQHLIKSIHTSSNIILILLVVSAIEIVILQHTSSQYIPSFITANSFILFILLTRRLSAAHGKKVTETIVRQITTAYVKLILAYLIVSGMKLSNCFSHSVTTTIDGQTISGKIMGINIFGVKIHRTGEDAPLCIPPKKLSGNMYAVEEINGFRFASDFVVRMDKFELMEESLKNIIQSVKMTENQKNENLFVDDSVLLKSVDTEQLTAQAKIRISFVLQTSVENEFLRVKADVLRKVIQAYKNVSSEGGDRMDEEGGDRKDGG